MKPTQEDGMRLVHLFGTAAAAAAAARTERRRKEKKFVFQKGHC
jgi:hypothetical protein